ncbi:MAG: Mur ligase family protein, partial [Bdellovibrionales bacterium]
AFLSRLCEPFLSAVTTVGESHLEGLGSVEQVAEEKKQIYMTNPPPVCVLNRDNFYTENMLQELSALSRKIISFSKEKKEVDVHLNFVKETPELSIVEGLLQGVSSKSEVAFSGEHNLENLMCACSIALGAGMKPQHIWDQMSQCQLPEGRQKWFPMNNQKSCILFDSYNSNPMSMRAFLRTCERAPFSKKVFVLGDMQELGVHSEKYHKEIASHPVLLKAFMVCFIGDYGSIFEKTLRDKGFQGEFLKMSHYDKKSLLFLQDLLNNPCLLGIKASRSLALERLFFDLTKTKTL